MTLLPLATIGWLQKNLAPKSNINCATRNSRFINILGFCTFCNI